MKQASVILLATLALGLALSPVLAPEAGAQSAPVVQRVLGPGAYVYQTRLDTATCEEDSNSGHTDSFFAAIDGVPGAARMNMTLLNSQYWPRWDLSVREDGTLVGDATLRGQQGANAPHSHFEVQRRGDHLRGRGFREYNMTTNGQTRRCRMDFDVLLRRLDRSNPS